MRRLNLKDGVPYGFMSYHLAQHVFKMASAAFLTGPVLPLLARLKTVRIKSAFQTMLISTADAEASELLRVALNTPVVLARRIVLDAKSTAIFVSDITYRGDRVRFDVDLLPGSPFGAKEHPRNGTHAQSAVTRQAYSRRS
jgi:GntR family transcriptional regulator